MSGWRPRSDGGGGGTLPVPPIPPVGGAPSPSWPLNPQSAGRLWMRKWGLSIGPQSGQNALDLSRLGFNFEVEKTKGMTCWRGRITIYNPNSAIVNGLQKQYTHVVLQAGYQPPSQQYGIIFAAPIAWYKYGRLNATDTYIELHGITGDEAATQAVVNTTLPSGSSQLDKVNACLTAMKPYGVTAGYITDLGDIKSSRGMLLYGLCRDVLRDVVRTASANYHIDDDLKLHILKEFESFQTEQVPVLNSKSGMVDVPYQTSDGGIEVTCLLNYAIRPGRRINLNNQDVVQSTQSPSGDVSRLVDDSQRLQIQAMGMHKDGFYEVGKVRHFGDNRGNPWFSYLMTTPVTATGASQPQVPRSA